MNNYEVTLSIVFTNKSPAVRLLEKLKAMMSRYSKYSRVIVELREWRS